MKTKKGIFCLEGQWYGHLDRTSVYPVLELLERYAKSPFHYHKCETPEEFEYCLLQWKIKSFHTKYPILYLAFHGEKGILNVGKKKQYTLDDLAAILGDSCKGVVIHFGSCETVNIDERLIKKFLANTGAIAAFGYKKEVDWMMSAAFEILLLEALQLDKFDGIGIKKIKSKIITEYGNLHKLLDFRIILNDKTYFPRKRTK